VLEGAINFGGLALGSTALRDVTRAAVAVSGDITGNIDAAHIRRIQTWGRTTGTPPNTTYLGGKITGNITAHSPDFATVCGNSGFTVFRAMGVIWAGDEVGGTISCTSDDATFPGGLTWLLIGREGNPSIDGLTGDVRIDYGTIEKVHTAGPIGTSTLTPKVWAGRTIHEIRVLDAADIGNEFSTAVGNSGIKADVRTGLNLPTVTSPDPTTSDAPLYLIETDGDLEGEVTVANLAARFTGSRQYGIIIGGVITAPITVKYNVEIVDIIAASIEAPIKVGVSYKGAIVATASDGHIESVEIGYANEGLTEEDEDYDPVVEVYDTTYPRGFKGTDCRPVDPHFAAPFGGYTHADWTAEVLHCFGDNYAYDYGSVDCVIRAATIGSVRLAAMSELWRFNSTKVYFPRVESPVIGSLEIGLLRAGVVWSGVLTSVEGEMVWDPEEAYSNIGSIHVGCIGQSGDLWVDGTTRIEIAGDVLGQVHLPRLEETLWIGGRVGLWSAFGGSCADQGVGSGGIATTSEEDSPRDQTWTGENTAARGEIIIREVEGLTATGQIIINGGNLLAEGDGWDGPVIVGDALGIGNRIVITRNINDAEFHADFEAPYYDALPAELGGGSVGLAPFHLHGTACTPPLDETTADNGNLPLVYTDFDGVDYPVIIRSYGPVTGAGVSVRMGMLDNNCPSADVGVMFIKQHAPDPDNDPREIGIRCTSQSSMKEGSFAVYPTSVACDDVDGSPAVVWPLESCPDPEQRYLFLVGPDCNANGVDDREDIALDGSIDVEAPFGVIDACSYKDCRCDWDRSGTFTVSDIFAFLSAWFAQCDGTGGTGVAPCYGRDADFDEMNGIGVPDIFAFLSCWFSSQGENCNLP